MLSAGASPSPLTHPLAHGLHRVVAVSKGRSANNPFRLECAKTFPAMVVSVVKKSKAAGTKSVNVVHLVERAYEVWPGELKQAMAEQGAGAAFIFQAIPMHLKDVRNQLAALPCARGPWVCTHVHTDSHPQPRPHTHTHMRAQTHTHSHTHTHTHTHR
jgi:hypothetical protein